MPPYYHNKGAAKDLIKKFDRIKELRDEASRINVQKRYCDDDERKELDEKYLKVQTELNKLTIKGK